MPQNSVSSDPLMAPSPEIPGGFTTGNSGGNGFGLYDFLENLTWALNGGMLYADFNNPRYYTSEAPSQLERPEQLIGALGIQGGAKILSIASNRISKTAPNIANKVNNVLPLGNNAARGSTALRLVGSLFESVSDVMTNPNLLSGKSLYQVRGVLNGSKGWVDDVMKHTRSSDKGWVFKKINTFGNPTGHRIQYHPGSRRHFGGNPYWKISNGNTVTRVPAGF